MADEILYKINNAEYKAKFILTQEGGTSEQINFSKSAVRGMDIEENFFEPFTNGNIYLNNALDMIEDGNLIRGDGKDEFEIQFEPTDQGSGDGGAVRKPLNYKFVISNELNSTSKTDRLNNFKTYQLLDANYHKLNAAIPYGKRFRGKVGNIILEIFEEFGMSVAGCGGDWEVGDMEIDLLPEHFLPPTTFRYSDLIKYLLKINFVKHGKTYWRIFLYWCRECGEFKYKSPATIFPEYAEHLIEQFMADDLIGDPKTEKKLVNPNNPGTGVGYTPTNVNNSPLMNSDFSSPMLIYTNAFFNNLLVSNYDPILGEHIMNLIRIKDVKSEWKKKVVDPFTYVGGTPQPWCILNTQKQNVFRNLGFPFPTDRMAQLAEAELTTNMTFFNLQLNIDTLGNVNRQPGEFIDVSAARAQKGDGENPYSGDDINHRSDAKVFGTWFITKVRHEFSSSKVDNYTNLLQCIKPHIGPGTPVPSDCI